MYFDQQHLSGASLKKHNENLMPMSFIKMIYFIFFKFSANSFLGIIWSVQEILFSACQTVLSLVFLIASTKKLGTNCVYVPDCQ